MKKLFDTNQAAEYLGTTPNTLKAGRNTGILWSQPAPVYIKIGGRSVRYKKSTLDAWLADLPEEQHNTAQNK